MLCVASPAQVVLVGDPQQLPATLFSQKAKEVQLERSMFERLQQVRTAFSSSGGFQSRNYH